ncbi:MAG: hypothetical protein DMG07_14575 [Acidobacteria bacterium]|nr:MAG: hypothetical protein DMG07_14575 [Acidobacteriota bacterium]
MQSLTQDVRFAARLLWKEKGFAFTTVATLALAIGVNAATFSLLRSVVLKPLPFAESERILLLYNSYPKAGVERASNSAGDYYDRLRDLTVFESQAMYNFPGVTVGEKGSVERVAAMAVTPSFFSLLRAQPLLGRAFTEEEGTQGHERKVILSHALWQKLYGGQASAVGRDLRIGGTPHTIVGVMPRDFAYLDPEVRLWRPLVFTPEQKSAHHSNNWEMIGRLRPGATLSQARAQIDALNAANLERYPELKQILINAGFHTRVVGLQDEVVRDVRGTLYLLWGAVLFVLLIGAVNIANLALARARARMSELATRFALGAGRWRVARQLLTESFLLTGASAAAGLSFGYWGLRGVTSLKLGQIPRANEIAMDGTVVAVVLGLALAVTVAIYLIPVAHALRLDLGTVLRSEGRTGTSGRATRVWRNALVVAQVALALVLLFGAGLLLQSFRQVLAVQPGFAPARVLTASVSLPSTRYKGAADQRAFMARALERIRALPAVEHAGATDTVPFGNNYSDSVILAEGYTMRPGESLVSPNQVVVTPGYFETMGIPLLAGRVFDDRDTEQSSKVIVIDERLARRFWQDASPIGKRMWRPTSAESLAHPEKGVEWFTVAGVVGSVKLRALVDPDERVGAYYFPFSQSPGSQMTFALRTGAEPDRLAAALRSAVAELDPELPLYDVHAMKERIDDSLVTRRLPMLVTVGFGAAALVLATIGVYGVLAYMVAQRTREIGIRMALGSSAGGIFGLVLREGAAIVGAGVLLGLGGAAALAKYVAAVLYNVRPLDPRVALSVSALLGAVALLASVLPARRAAAVDPVVALREQ